jgi:uncharacterized protein YbjT (DUF2867 family)
MLLLLLLFVVPSAALRGPVVVAGATGRVGRLVVEQLLAQDTPVRALVRDRDAASAVLPPSCALVECDLASQGADAAVRSACDGAHSLIFCATGLAEASASDAPQRTNSIDLLGIELCAAAFIKAASTDPQGCGLPS